MLCIAGAQAGAVDLPPVPESEYDIIDACDYAGDAAARASWQTSSDSAAPSVVRTGDRNVLRLPVKPGKVARVAWSKTIALDLTGAGGIRFKLFCDDPDAVSYFRFDISSGNGTYPCYFSPDSATGWNTISVNVARLGVWGVPAGLGRVNRLTLIAHSVRERGGAATDLYIADVGLLGSKAPVVLLREDSSSKEARRRRKLVRQFCGVVADRLDAAGVPYNVMADVDVASVGLSGRKLVILPAHYAMAPSAAEALVEFARKGGGLILFGDVPGELRSHVGIGGSGKVAWQKYDGQFSTLALAPGAVFGAPSDVGLRASSIYEVEPIEGSSRVLAWWRDGEGKRTDRAAVVASDRCISVGASLTSRDVRNQDRMMLALVARFLPDLWPAGVQAFVEGIHDIADYRSFAEAANDIHKTAGRKIAVLKQLATARALRKRAVELAGAGKHPEAMDFCGLARSAMEEAYFAAQPAVAGEFRAAACNNEYGIPGWGWDRCVKHLADNGFTAVVPEMLVCGLAYHPSEVVPVSPKLKTRGDPVAECLAACRKYGLEMHVWRACLILNRRAPKEFYARMKKEERMACDAKGVPHRRWLCPSHPANVQFEVDSVVELIEKYKVDGILFDYIRYPSGNYCFCRECRKRFEKAYGVQVKQWPADVLKDGEFRQQWLQFRRDNITNVVARVTEAVRKIRPEVKFSASVFPNSASARDTEGQDWPLWCERGYLDMVCPMDYYRSNATLERSLRRQIREAGKAACYPIIAVPARDGKLDRPVTQVQISRRAGARGFAIFNYASPEAAAVVETMGKGTSAK